MTAYTFQQLIDFTRTSAGTFVGSNGLIQNTPQSRNLLTWTQEFDNAAWTKTRVNVTANSTTAPDGTSTADTLTCNTGTSDSVSQAPTLVAAVHTFSIYFRATATASTVNLGLFVGGFLASSAQVLSGPGSVSGSGLISVSGLSTTQWTRVSVTTTSAVPAGVVQILMYPGGGNTVGAATVAWGAQLEQASTASDYTRNVGGLFPPRFDYDPVTLAPRGILIEEQRVNRTLQSENFTVSPWAATVTGTSTRTNTDTALGFMRGLITATSVNGGIRQTYSSLSSGQVYALSFYIQSASTSVAISLENGLATYGTQCDVTINPAAGTFGFLVGFTSARVTPFGSGYIYEIMLPAAGGTLTANIEWRIPTSGNSMLYGRPQLEAGAFATSYIPTVASQVTRTADQASIVAPMFAPWYNQSEGTFVVDVDVLSVANTNDHNFAALYLNSTTAIRSWMWSGTPTLPRATVFNGTTQAELAAASGVSANTPFKAALAYKANDFGASYNGATAVTDNSGTVPTGFTQFNIGNYTGSGNFMSGHIRSIRYFPTRLSNAQLQALTA